MHGWHTSQREKPGIIGVVTPVSAIFSLFQKNGQTALPTQGRVHNRALAICLDNCDVKFRRPRPGRSFAHIPPFLIDMRRRDAGLAATGLG